MRNRMVFCACVVTGLLAAGCAGGGHVRNEVVVYERHAGANVQQARVGNVINWQPVGSNLILLDSGRGGAYLIEPSLPCKGNVRYGQILAFPGQGLIGTLRTMDTLLLDGQRCQVISIRPVDREAARAELGDQASERGM